MKDYKEEQKEQAAKKRKQTSIGDFLAKKAKQNWGKKVNLKMTLNNRELVQVDHSGRKGGLINDSLGWISHND